MLEAFLDSRVDETIFLRAAVRAGGVHVTGGPDGLAGHDARGILHVHGFTDARAALAPGRPLVAVAGPPADVEAALAVLGARAKRSSREQVFGLDLADLVVPELVASGAARTRRAGPEDLPLLVEWRRSYDEAVHHHATDPAQAAAEVRAQQEAGLLWLLEHEGERVASISYEAAFPEVVQIEHGWVPAELRSRGYIRSVAAGALLVSRAGGVRRGVIYAHESNRPVQAATLSLGFRRTGDFLVAFV